MNITFRTAQETDYEAIAKLHARSWKENYRGIMKDHYLDNIVDINRLTEWEGRISNPAKNQYVLLAIENDEMIGFVCLFTNESSEYGSYLDNLHVVSSKIGMGIGTLLMKKSAKYIEDQLDDKRMYLWVLEKNLKAIKLYKKLGGEMRDKVYKNVHGAGVLPIIRFVWPDVRKLLNNLSSTDNLITA